LTDDSLYLESEQPPTGDGQPAVPEADTAPAVEPDAALPVPARPRRTLRADALCYGLLAIVLAVAAWLRFDAQNWDDYSHLHPDERFLTDVVSLLGSSLQFTGGSPAEQEAQRARCEARYPAASADPFESLLGAGRGGYFDAECSPLNPNNIGKGLYVYGEFPLFTVHAAGVARSQLSRDYHALLLAFDEDGVIDHRVTTHWEGYSGAQLIGRSVSALADWLTVGLLFLLGRRLYGRWTGLLAAALYGVAAFPIQQSHFWTVDAFTAFWTTLALYFAARVMDGAGLRQGPIALWYALIWFGGTMWDAGASDYPMIGLLSLGAGGLLAFALLSAVSAWGGWRRTWLPGLAGVIASLAHLALWAALDLLAPHELTLTRDVLALGAASLVYALAVLAICVAASQIRRRAHGETPAREGTAAIGVVVGLLWIGLVAGVLTGLLAAWATLFVALVATLLLVCDTTELTDYALFGVALGGAVASRINVAPLAGIVVIAAALRVLPALDAALHRSQRSRLIASALTGVVTAALLSLIVFRLLQPHAFLGPGIFGLKFNPGWREDIAEAAHLTSGEWDGPPDHQWASRIPYLYPWRNIVLWGFGLPLGLLAWGGWAWAGLSMLRARRGWARHAILVAWVLVIFGWLGGRWVTTMRYFLPLYPALALLGAWALVALLGAARRRHRLGLRRGRLALIGAVTLLVFVTGYTVLYGFAFHTIHRQQLTRVAASRWFQEFVPGDFGVWVEGDDGTRQMVNVGRGYVAPPPTVTRLEQDETVELPFTVRADARLTAIAFNHLLDPLADAEPETLRVRIFRDDPALGRQLVFEDAIQADLAQTDAVYGQAYAVEPVDDVLLAAPLDPNAQPAPYLLEVAVVQGGPLTSVRDVSGVEGAVLSDISLALSAVGDGVPATVDLNFEAQLLLYGHGDDIPGTPTHWTVGGSDALAFEIPIDGVIREIEIPHLGDPLRDSGEEAVRLTLTAPDGTQTSTELRGDFNEGANPLGLPQVAVFDPPLRVERLDASGQRQLATLTVEALDPVYTSGAVIAWEGDWDDPIPWTVCPLPDDVVYRDDLPSGLSTYDCPAVNMFGGHVQGIKLWMVAEDNDEKIAAMTNALDQADYLVISSNRFYDSLSRIPWRWPMSLVFYEALFDGRLGYELVRQFESAPQLGPFRVRDQVTPLDDLPDWVNEHWEAEEAFSVYDHPIVLVFRRTDAYSPEDTRALLESVTTRSVRAAFPGYVADPEPVGVVTWRAQKATQSPTLLHFDADTWATQRAGGTWRDLFAPESLLNRSQVAALIAWWLLIVLAGWVAWPLLFVALPALPDRAYPAAKITAWLIVGWVAWVGGTLGLRTWSRGGLALILLALAALSSAVVWRRRGQLAAYVRANWRLLLALEALTLALFLAFVGVRLSNPDLWHGSFGGEKPMDFAYFNAVLRSTVFPPLDPWFSGGYINYYYFGYVIVGAPVKLLGIAPSVAYNLIIPALFAMTGIGVFSIAYNWVRARSAGTGQSVGATGRSASPPKSPFPAESVGTDSDGESTTVGLSDLPHPRPRSAWPAPSPYMERGQRGASAPSGGEVESGITSNSAYSAYLSALEPVGPEKGTGASGDAPRRGGAEGEPRSPKGSAWLAGLLALLLALVLGNLGTLHVVVTNIAALDGWSQPPLYEQVRRQEIQAQRDQLYQKLYAEEVKKFRAKHGGQEPSEAGDMFAVTDAAQRRVEAAIEDYAEHPPLLRLWQYELGNLREQVGAFFGGLSKVLDGQPLPMHTHRWYWGPTRIISELPDGAGRGAIAEMPYFTFLYGDLHAHMIAFPVTLLVVLWLLAEIIGAGHALRTWWEAGLALALGALAVGVLRPTNSWDWITYLLLGVAGLTFVAWLGAARARRGDPPPEIAGRLWEPLRPSRVRKLWLILLVLPVALTARVGFFFVQRALADQEAARGARVDPVTLSLSSTVAWMIAGLVLVVALYAAALIAARIRLDRRLLWAWIGRVALFVGLTFVVGLPFTAYFATAYNSVKPWEQETTPLWAYLYVHGTFIFLVISLLAWQTARWLRRVRVRALEGLAVPVLGIGGGLLLVIAGSIVYGVREAAVAQLAGPLIAWAALLFFLPGQSALVRALNALIALALAISLGVELVVLDGDIGRQNTVFKFYLQVWFLLSIVGGVGLAWMLRSAGRWHPLLRALWQGALAVLLITAALYPVLATRARALDRFNREETPLTLDGMEYMKYALHGEFGLYFRLDGDYNMIRWLQENVEGTPVVMEAHLYPSEYHWGGRISIYTGLPTMLGWRFHQIQQHSLEDMNLLVQTRENNAAAFYSLGGEEGIRAALRLIDHYDIEYIVVGTLERAFYGDIIPDATTGLQTAGHAEGLAKFDAMAAAGLLEVVYSAGRCLSTAITDAAACPAAQVYTDRIYRVVTAATQGKETAWMFR